jgi:uncharacterized repeat protein (TIGR01451 family)
MTSTQGYTLAAKWPASALFGVVLVVLAALALAPVAHAEQAASSDRGLQAAALDGGGFHACAITDTSHDLRCWGDGSFGKLGYGNTNAIGDSESPATAGGVFLGPGRSARAVSAGDDQTCALLDDFNVRCWGRNDNGQLGQGNATIIGDNETPGSVAPIDFGGGHSARAISSGGFHSCAILDDGSVKCWGFGGNGRLGYGNGLTIGDNETPAAVGPVNLGAGRTAKAISTGGTHTCAILDNDTVKCWGKGLNGELGYGNTNDIGDNETPDTVGVVNLGAGRTAKAISAGGAMTCALLDNNTIRCWGSGFQGELGYGNVNDIGDNETPDTVGPVDIGTGFPAVAIAAGGSSVCAVRAEGTLVCWGFGNDGRLGYGNIDNIGDNEVPGANTVQLASGNVRASSVGGNFSCASLDNGTVRCFGRGSSGQLGYGNGNSIGDDELPSSVPAPAFLGGLVPGSIGDISLTQTADAASRQVGETVTLTTALSNAGPDTVGGIEVGTALPAGLSFVSATPTQGTYDPQTGGWSVGTVTQGGSATLSITARVTGTGTLSSVAEELAAGAPDPDSTPGNHVNGEDDRATATITGTAPPAPVITGAGGAGAGGAGTTPPDTTAPGVTIAGVPKSIKLKKFLKSGLTAKLTPTEASTFTVDLLGSTSKVVLSRAFNLNLAHGTLGLGAGARNVKLKPKKSLVGKARKFTVRVQVVAADAAGNRTTKTVSVKVKK